VADHIRLHPASPASAELSREGSSPPNCRGLRP
jgi:hypothetical protein